MKVLSVVAALMGAAGILLTPSIGQCQGVVLPGMGPVNRSMAGAGTGAPIDAAGALHWNPASIAGLKQNEMMFGAEFLNVRTEVSSTFPQLGSGVTDSESGVAVLPTSAIVYKPQESPFTYGLGVFTIGGFGANYPADAGNPIFGPPPPGGAGVGAVFSQVALVQFAPTAAVWLTDDLAVGVAPTFTMASLGLDPAFFAAPDDANLDGVPTYPAATHSRYHWGLGFQLGLYYEPEGPWSFGVSFKSPQWFETFKFNATDEAGNGRRLNANVDYPMIVSTGVGFRPTDRILMATDVRYIGYDSTDGFGDRAAYGPTGAVTGLGWKDVISVANGLQYIVSSSTSVRMGYLYNTNPIPDQATFFNIASPPIFQHAVFLGASQKLTQSIMVSASYLHAFENSIKGPYVTPGGAVPGASVGINEATDAITVAMQVYF